MTEPTMRKKCLKCGSRDYTISAPLERITKIKHGKLVWKMFRRYDAGQFHCDKCGWTETY